MAINDWICDSVYDVINDIQHSQGWLSIIKLTVKLCIITDSPRIEDLTRGG